MVHIKVVNDQYVIPAGVEPWESRLKTVPLKKKSQAQADTWLLPFKQEIYEKLRDAKFPISHLSAPTEALFTCDVYTRSGKSVLAVTTPNLRAYIAVCKAIPDGGSWFPALESWFCDVTAANTQYLRTHLPLLKWTPAAEALARAAEQEKQHKDETLQQLVKDFKFALPPKAHQLREFHASRDNEYWAYNWDMGTGKTKLTLDVTAWNYVRGRICGLVVVCPNNVLSTWEEEVATHVPSYVQRAIYVSKFTKDVTLAQFMDPNYAKGKLKILVTNYEMWVDKTKVKTFAQFLATHPSMMVLDEYTRVKNRTSKRTKGILSVRTLAAMRRILSGTPTTQSPLDLFAPYQFLDPSILGYSNWYVMRNEHAVMGGFNGRQIVSFKNVDVLEQKIRRASSRVLLHECVDLPPKVYKRLVVQLTATQREIYDDVLNDLKHESDIGAITVDQALIRTLRLQQITGGFMTLDPTEIDHPREVVNIPGPNPKIDALLELVADSPGKVIVWARFRREIAVIAAALRDVYGLDAVGEFHGGVNDADRTHVRHQFQDPHSPLRFFVGQVQSGGVGITLTAASYVVYYSNTYSLEDRLQSENRAHRIGQTRTVIYTDIVAHRTWDAAIIRALRAKKNLADCITGDAWNEWM